MKIEGERALDVPIQQVWDSLFDPAVLQQCIPGCEKVTREEDGHYEAVTVLAIGPLKARFSGVLHINDAVAPHTCTLVFEGAGGAAGMAKGRAFVTLREGEEGEEGQPGTVLSYEADTQISGKLAQVGARLIEGVARKLSASFFDKFESALVPSEPA